MMNLTEEGTAIKKHEDLSASLETSPKPIAIAKSDVEECLEKQ